MVILVKSVLTAYALNNPDTAKALNNWYRIVKTAGWNSLTDIKIAFNHVDYVGNDRYVFNIKGNSHRLVTMIFFDKRTVFIRFIGTHREYDRINCSNI